MKKDKPAVSTSTKPRRKRWTSDDTELTLLGLPAAIWYAVFCYLPMFGLIIAFKNFKITPGRGFLYSLFHSDWAGFDNFKFFLTSNTFTMLLRNTLLYNILFIVLNIVIPVTLAVLINQIYSRIASKAYQTMMFFPYFLSWVVASYFVMAFLDPTSGMIPALQKSMGIKPTNFYHDTTYWPLILTLCSMWKNIGYSSVLYLAAITGIDTSLYEAAAVDGATKWQQVKNITLPSIRTMIIILLIMNVGKIFNADFGLFYNVPQNSGSLYPVTQVIDTYVYRAYANTHNMGMSSAAGLLQSVVGCFCILITNGIVRKMDPDSALF